MDTRPAQRLALIEVHERDGRSQRLVDVHAWPVRIGRALSNELMLDDPHVAAQHAQLVLDDEGRVALQLLETRNGARLNQQRVPPGGLLVLPPEGGTLTLGTTQLRVRLPGEALPPELPMPSAARIGTPLALAAGGALLAVEFGSHWLSLDPGADYSAWLSTAFGLPLALALWCGLWAFLSKLFRHRFDFMGHVRIAMPWLLAIVVVGALWPQLAASLSWPLLWHLTAPLQAVLGALLVRQHLAHALPTHPRAVTASVALCALVGAGIAAAGNLRSSDSLFSAPYMSTLPLPALRWAGQSDAATLVKDLGPLAEQLAVRAKKARDENPGDGEAGAED